MRIPGWSVLTALVGCLLLAAPASATFLGFNGKISFNRFSELPDDQFQIDLFSVNPDGSGVFQLTNFGPDTFSEFSDHSPDGRTLAFQRFDFESEESSPATQVWLTDADGTNARQLTAFAETDAYEGAFDPAFSPDGRTLVIDAVARGVPGIFVIPARARHGKLITEAHARRVTSVPAGTAFDSEPQFSPDGRWIVFTRFSIECISDEAFEDCRTRIYKVRPNGKDMRLLVGPELNGSAPDWHPTGLAIAFDVHDNFFAPNAGHIMVMLADGSHKRVIVRGDADSHYGNPCFSPDGTRIAYTHWPLGPEGDPTGSHIWTAWVTGAHPRQLTDGDDNKADWGPRPRRGHGWD